MILVWRFSTKSCSDWKQRERGTCGPRSPFWWRLVKWYRVWSNWQSNFARKVHFLKSQNRYLFLLLLFRRVILIVIPFIVAAGIKCYCLFLFVLNYLVRFHEISGEFSWTLKFYYFFQIKMFLQRILVAGRALRFGQTSSFLAKSVSFFYFRTF